MRQRAGAELEIQVRLVREITVDALVDLPRARDEAGQRIERGRILDHGDDRQSMVVAVAREIAQRHTRREVVLDACRVTVGVDVVEVDAGDAVEVVLVDVADRRRRGRETGQCR